MWGESSKCTGEGVASCLAWQQEAFIETRVEPGKAVDGDPEKEGHPGPEKMHEQTYRGMKGNAGSGNGVDLGWVEARRQVVGEGARTGREWGSQMGKRMPARSKHSALFYGEGNSIRNR